MVNNGCLKPEEFLVKAAEFFKIANEMKISVHLTVKRLINKDEVEGNSELNASEHPDFDISKQSSLSRDRTISEESYPLLIRISYGSHAKKTKCSTIVNADSLDKFWQDYSSVIKSGAHGLLKKKKRKNKSTAAKDKKKKTSRK